MKKIVPLFFFLLSVYNQNAFSADHDNEIIIRRPFVIQNWSQPDIRPDKATAKKCSKRMDTLFRWMNTLEHKENTFEILRTNPGLVRILKSIPGEYFLWEAEKTRSLSENGLWIKKLVDKRVIHCTFLAAAKIAIGLEATNIKMFAEKYKFSQEEFTRNASIYGLTNFNQFFA